MVIIHMDSMWTGQSSGLQWTPLHSTLLQSCAIWVDLAVERVHWSPLESIWNMGGTDKTSQNPLEILEAQIRNPDFDGKIDYAPKQVLGKNGKCQFTEMLSGDWAWEQVCSYFLYSMNNLNKLSHFTIG